MLTACGTPGPPSKGLLAPQEAAGPWFENRCFKGSFLASPWALSLAAPKTRLSFPRLVRRGEERKEAPHPPALTSPQSKEADRPPAAERVPGRAIPRPICSAALLGTWPQSPRHRTAGASCGRQHLGPGPARPAAVRPRPSRRHGVGRDCPHFTSPGGGRLRYVVAAGAPGGGRHLPHSGCSHPIPQPEVPPRLQSCPGGGGGNFRWVPGKGAGRGGGGASVPEEGCAAVRGGRCVQVRGICCSCRTAALVRCPEQVEGGK